MTAIYKAIPSVATIEGILDWLGEWEDESVLDQVEAMWAEDGPYEFMCSLGSLLGYDIHSYCRDGSLDEPVCDYMESGDIYNTTLILDVDYDRLYLTDMGTYREWRSS